METPKPQFIVDGLLVQRTPTMRTLLFAEEAARDVWMRFQEQSSYLVVGVIAVGVLLKLLQSAGVISGEAAFGMVVLAMVPVFLGTSILIVRQHLQLRGRVEKLSWERSVALDMRPISDRETLKVAGLALLVLAIAVAVCALGDWERMWRKEPITCVFMGGFGILALIGGGALAWGAMARIHYCRVRKRLLGRRLP